MGEEVDSEDAERAREETVELLLAEAQLSMNRQLDTIDALDSKASRLFQVVTLSTTLLTISQGFFFQKEEVAGLLPCWFVLGGFGIAIGLYLATLALLVCAYKTRVYYLPLKMDAQHIRTTYLGLTKLKAQELLLSSYVQHSQVNWVLVSDKAKAIRWALYLVGANITLLILAIAVGTVVVSR